MKGRIGACVLREGAGMEGRSRVLGRGGAGAANGRFQQRPRAPSQPGGQGWDIQGYASPREGLMVGQHRMLSNTQGRTTF